MANIKDVARVAETSVTSVSLVLNNRENRISDEKRKRIISAAKELNYHPNRIARSLKSKRSNTIALVVPDISNPSYSGFSKQILENLRKKGINLVIYDNDNKVENDINCLENLRTHGADAAIVILSNARQTPEESTRFIELFDKIDMPIVMVNRIMSQFGCYGVTVDHRKGGYLATRHLLELGHRRIGCLSNSLMPRSAEERFLGYCDALDEYGIKLDESIVRRGDYTFGNAYCLAGELEKTDITACFVCTDLMAHAAVKRFLDDGRRVPEDISVVGFDDVFFSSISLVPLTTVHTPMQDIADKAIALIDEALTDDGKKREIIVMAPSLVVRESTCAPREGAVKQ